MNDMTNSHILVHEFTYMEPVSVAEAISLLASHGNAARVLAGGTDLLVQMKMERQSRPMSSASASWSSCKASGRTLTD